MSDRIEMTTWPEERVAQERWVEQSERGVRANDWRFWHWDEERGGPRRVALLSDDWAEYLAVEPVAEDRVWVAEVLAAVPEVLKLASCGRETERDWRWFLANCDEPGLTHGERNRVATMRAKLRKWARDA